MPHIRSVIDSLVSSLGPDGVITDPSVLESTSHDSWPLATKWAQIGLHPYQADVVVRVHSAPEVVRVLEIAAGTATPVTVRAGGSSVTGQPLPVAGGIVLDLSQWPAEHSLNGIDMTVTASASYNGGALEEELATQGWTLGHSPQSLYRSSVGGWLAGAQRLMVEARQADVPAQMAALWVRRYGSNAALILRIWQAEPSRHEVIGDGELSRAEMIYGVQDEMVRTLADLLVRRTSAFFWEPDGGLSTVHAVADELQRLVPWTDAQRLTEVENYRKLVQQHRPFPIDLR